MKTVHLITTTALALLLLPSSALGQRNTIWLRGFTDTSLGWDLTRNSMQGLYDYDFVDLVSTNPSASSSYTPVLGIRNLDAPMSETTAMKMESMLDNHDDVLGIAHDFGGLVLRELANSDNSLSAMILDGVPNQGSAGIKALTETDASSKTRVQRMIERAQAIKADEDCEDCDIVESFQSWADAITNENIPFEQMAANSPEMNYLNSNAPSIPYAVLWGSVKTPDMPAFLSAYFSPSRPFSDDLGDCYAQKLNDARAEANDVFLLSTIENTVGFFANALRTIGSLIGDGQVSPGAIINAAGEAIQNQLDLVTSQFEAIKERDRELARILRCETANRLVFTDWQLELAAQGGGEIGTEEVPLFREVNQPICIQYCQGQFAGFPGLTLFGDCVTNCLQNIPSQTVPVFLPEENDGLLLKSEQMLAGAAFVYHLEEHNHFQETILSKLDKPGTLGHALQELFDGAAGAAFAVPKQ